MGVDEIQKLAVRDKLTRSYGHVAAVLEGHDPGLEPIAAVWGSLTPAQKDDLTVMIQALARSNR